MTFDGHHQFEEINVDNDPPMGIVKNPRLVSKVTKAVATSVSQHLEGGHLPLTLGGDHSLVRAYQDRAYNVDPPIGHWHDIRLSKVCRVTHIPLPYAHQYPSKFPDTCVVWVDAHADINTIESTDSGTWFISLWIQWLIGGQR